LFLVSQQNVEGYIGVSDLVMVQGFLNGQSNAQIENCLVEQFFQEKACFQHSAVVSPQIWLLSV
jgi:hypothetical protein